MSKKGHGPKTGGEFDRNFTPRWAVDRLLEKWRPENPGGIWLEPGAGKGNIIRAVNRQMAVFWHAVELNGDFADDLRDAGANIVTIANFLTGMPKTLSDVTVALGNPPFTWCAEFLLQIWRLCPGAEVVLLLPLNFESSKDRHPIVSKRTPDRYVLPNRPSFTDDGQTDAQDYAWFRWLPRNRQKGRTTILNLTPLAERQACE